MTRAQLGPTIYSNIAIRGITVENRGNFRLNLLAQGLPRTLRFNARLSF